MFRLFFSVSSSLFFILHGFVMRCSAGHTERDQKSPAFLFYFFLPFFPSFLSFLLSLYLWPVHWAHQCCCPARYHQTLPTCLWHGSCRCWYIHLLYLNVLSSSFISTTCLRLDYSEAGKLYNSVCPVKFRTLLVCRCFRNFDFASVLKFCPTQIGKNAMIIHNLAIMQHIKGYKLVKTPMDTKYNTEEVVLPKNPFPTL